MQIGKQIFNLRKEKNLTQEEFGELFFVTRQTVSHWENGKSYPDLQTLIQISDRFTVSLDNLIKGDPDLVTSIDKNKFLADHRRKTTITAALSSAGTGIVVSCFLSPPSPIRTVAIAVGIALICIGWHKRAQQDKTVLQYLQDHG